MRQRQRYTGRYSGEKDAGFSDKRRSARLDQKRRLSDCKYDLI